MAPQMQWGLDKTAESALNLGQDVLLAAENDDIQPSAIVVCERFGNTLVMCDATCQTVQDLVDRSPEQVAINFVKAHVGFDASDSATLLAHTQGGKQFLGLAAVLISSLGVSQGAKTLHKMLINFTTEKVLIPKINQIKDLLSSLEPRLVRTRFLESVLDWQLLLKHSPLSIMDNSGILNVLTLDEYPSPDEIDGLVNTFRQLEQIEAADTDTIKIKAGNCLPWIIAFTEWCLGSPPSIYSHDGSMLWPQPGSKVDVFILDDMDFCSVLQISTYHAIQIPLETIIVQSRSWNSWSGMIRVEKYATWKLFMAGLSSATVSRVVLQAVPVAVKQLLELLRFSHCMDHTPSNWIDEEADEKYKPIEEHNWSSQAANEGEDTAGKDEEWEQIADRHRQLHVDLSMHPLPQNHVIGQVMSKYLGSELIVPAPIEGTRVEDVLLVQLHLQALKEACRCPSCYPRNTHFLPCLQDNFFRNLSSICADILALSLFDGIELPLVYLSKPEKNDAPQDDSWTFAHAIQAALKTGSSVSVSVYDLMSHTLGLLGHSHVPDDAWIMSSCKGQVIYPKFYESMRPEKRGFCSLIWLPGILRHDDETYTKVLASKDIGDRREVGIGNGKQPPIIQPLLLVSGLQLIWLARPDESGVLYITLGLNGFAGCESTCAPRGLLNKLANALLVQGCNHKPDASLETPDIFSEFTSPSIPESDEVSRNGLPITGIVAVDGSEKYRFYALASARSRLVLRRKACLSCCLEICRLSEHTTLIL